MAARGDSNNANTTRRSVLKAGLGAGAGALAASGFGASARAQADGQWWESIIGRGSQLGNVKPSARPNARPSAQQVKRDLGDLRSGPVPLRSDEMVENLLNAIGRYERIAAAGGWPKVPGPRLMRPGDDDDRVPLLRRRLRATGELGPPRYAYEGYNFDGELEAAVMRFQRRHGLRIRGRVDRPTFAALNIPADMRVAQLRLNMQRVRELIRQRIEDRYILVNVPAFQLEAVENHEVQRRHRVIVGRPTRETPAIKATIRALNFLPYWRVPESVARSDLIPQLQKDISYLEKERIRVFMDSYDGEELDPRTIDWSEADPSRIKFKQDPGEWNALGLLRIDMPNEHIVYMHDTPMKRLFGQSSRAYSAGCVRVQDVTKLADWIARHEIGWEQPGRTEMVIEARDELTLELTRPVPVYFTYITAWAENDGAVYFRPDIYDRDGSRVFAGDIDPDAPPPPPMLTP